MEKIIIIFIVSLFLSCTPNSGIHETVYRVDFCDGTTAFVVGYTVTTINDVYVVKSISNNSIFDANQVRGIYPKETGTVWNPYKKSLKE